MVFTIVLAAHQEISPETIMVVHTPMAPDFDLNTQTVAEDVAAVTVITNFSSTLPSEQCKRIAIIQRIASSACESCKQGQRRSTR